ncbi:hypothetical protein [Nonomuraea basaltis]|uniref:hypothetical protein n=1 Tax=Nonomuraea basaltis TaxID=2495887 RepID=UPI00110C6EF3|nr:hypothetical protein [Nonomuraea basaltis]TMR93834.1 hypothetical protein EJK15_37305 [Nonomuraea basaltis]
MLEFVALRLFYLIFCRILGRLTLALADSREPAARTQIADLIKRTLAETDTLPNAETIRRKIKTGQHLTQEITVEQWPAEFLNRKRKIKETTRRSYEGHIRLYLTPWRGSGWISSRSATSR